MPFPYSFLTTDNGNFPGRSFIAAFVPSHCQNQIRMIYHMQCLKGEVKKKKIQTVTKLGRAQASQ